MTFRCKEDEETAFNDFIASKSLKLYRKGLTKLVTEMFKVHILVNLYTVEIH